MGAECRRLRGSNDTGPDCGCSGKSCALDIDSCRTEPSAGQLLVAIEALLHWRVIATNENQGGLWFYDPAGMGTMPLGPRGLVEMYEKEAKARGWL